MKRYEIILTLIILVLFGLQIQLDSPETRSILTIAIWLLALSYILGGYWMLNTKDSKEKPLSILSGIAFGISLIAIPFIIRVRLSSYFNYLPILNGLLCISLIFYFIKNRGSSKPTGTKINTLLRSALIFIFTSLFTYLPVSFKPYNKILIALNSKDSSLINNIMMVGYLKDYEIAIKRGDCGKAIEAAEKAKNSGELWLRIKDKEIIGEKKDQCYRINKTYTNLYISYKCKADKALNDNQISTALKYYLKAHSNLMGCSKIPPFWQEEISWSLNNIAFCYTKLNQYDISDSLYIDAIKNYTKITGREDKGLAKLYSNLALSLTDRNKFYDSNILLGKSIQLLNKDKDTTNKEPSLINNYNGLALNYIHQDSFDSALKYLNLAMKSTDSSGRNSCNTKLFYGIYLYSLDEYQKADSIFKVSLQCFSNRSEPNPKNISECNLMLAKVNIILGNYTDAQKYIDTALKLATELYGAGSSTYAKYLRVLATLNVVTAKYQTAEKQYHNIIQIYKAELGKKNTMLPNVLSEFAFLQVILSRFNEAKQNIESSLSIASPYIPRTSPKMIMILNTAAYVDYSLGLYKSAGLFYKSILTINTENPTGSTASTAIALNGLGLNETAKKNYKKADSIFIKAIQLYREVFTDNNPLTAIVYLNYGILQLRENKLSDAEENINKALAIDKQFLKSDHDTFGDIYVALGDLAKRRGQREIAKDYYIKALDIYKNKFKVGHWKIISTQQKMR